MIGSKTNARDSEAGTDGTGARTMFATTLPVEASVRMQFVSEALGRSRRSHDVSNHTAEVSGAEKKQTS